ncbi:MAG: substrate-binding domain-containing protein [Spirochaetales bacterium]|nr:substrate-binding domain-containing protein [Spirochaetales bacterium]
MARQSLGILLVLISLVAAELASCRADPHAQASQSADRSRTLRIATTTSVEQSGLLELILDAYRRRSGISTNVIATGSGAALALAARGDCDLVISHAPDLEASFMAKRLGALRLPFMSGAFVLLGPEHDPAGAGKSSTIVDAFKAIAIQGARFVSRGDQSGTHQKELEIWSMLPDITRGSWYEEAGQGMAEVLSLADQLGAYVLSDRATWAAMRDRLSHLKVLQQGDALLRTTYSVIVPAASGAQRNLDAATDLARFLTGEVCAALIEGFSIQGEQCFFPYGKEAGQ